MYTEVTIGDRIRERREELGMTQAELAKYMGYKSRSSINKIEKGTNDIPQSKVIRFAEALNTTVSHLMGWDDNGELLANLNQDVLEYFDGDVEKALEFENAKAEDVMKESANNHFEEMSVEEILNVVQKILTNKSIKWAKTVPVYKRVMLNEKSACGFSFCDFMRYTQVDIDELDNNNNYICLTVPDDGLLPRFSTDNFALILQTDKIENEKYYYVLLKNSEKAFIRKVSTQNDILILQPDNPNMSLVFLKRDDIVVVGQVILIQKNEKL